MENEKEKKIFSPVIRPKSLDVKKRWYVEYYLPKHNGTVYERQRELGKINYKKTYEEKYAEALRLVDEIIGRHGTQKKNILQSALDVIVAGVKPRSVVTFQNHLNNFLDWWKKSPELLTEKDAVNYIAHMGLSKKPKTLYNERTTISRLYKKCLKDKLIPSNPFEDVKLKKVKSKSQMYFSPEERKIMKAYLIKNDPQTWLAAQLLYYCFIRPGEEQRWLKIEHIYMEQGVIEILGGPAKNGNTERVVIPKQLRPILRKLCKEWPKDYYVLGRNGHPSPHVLGHHTMFKRHRKAILALGFSNSYSMYSWKHSGAKELHDNNTPIKYIQMQLRHSSLEVTDEYLKNLTIADWKDLRDDFPDA